MSRKTTKLGLYRDEISLLINSEEAKNTQLYGNLYDILLLIKELKVITLEELENLNLNYHGISALTYNKHILINNATMEWQATTNIIDNPKRTARCQLCNASKLRYECHIRNTHNNIELLVGSECINKFKIDGYIAHKKQLAQIHKGHKIAQRRNEFYNNFPDYENFIFDAEEYFSTLPILLPYDIYSKLDDVVKRMRLICTKYINEGKKPFTSNYNCFKLFELAITQYNKLKIEADNYVLKNQNNLLLCKRSEIDWLISNNKINLLKQISENNGIYILDTLKYIWSIDYVKENQELIIDKNKSQLVKFVKYNGDNLVFSFNKFGYQPPIFFSVHIKDFMRDIGANCILDKDFYYSSKNILNISNILNLKNNLYSILNYIDNMISNFGCIFLIDGSTNALFLYRKGDSAIRAFNPYKFMRSYSKYILLPDEQLKKFLFAVTKGHSGIEWITIKEQSKQGIEDKINQLYKEYKETHDYGNSRINDNKFETIVYKISNRLLSNETFVDFDSPEYITWQRDKLKIGSNKLNSVDYAITIPDQSVEPFYHQGDILLVQIVSRVKNNDIILFVSPSGIYTKKCQTKEDFESIFNFINIPKRNIQTYGKIVYHIKINDAN